MSRSRLTDASIAKLKPSDNDRAEYFDELVPGFAVRVTSKGQKSFVLRARIKGHTNPIRLTIGKVGALSLADAREEAREALRTCGRGLDPREAIRRRKVEAEKAKDLHFEKIVERFIEGHAKKNKTGQEVEKTFVLHVTPKWKGRPITEISQSDVSSLLSGLEKKVSAARTNRILAAVRKLFNWAVLEGYLTKSPVVAGMTRKGEKARDRALSFDEISAVWQATESMEYPFGPLVRMLLVTGQRLGEVAPARWAAMDLESEKIWTLEAGDTKASRKHEVPLSPLALSIIGELPEIVDPKTKKPVYLFTTTGSTPVSGFGKAKSRLDELITGDGEPLKPWRLHDLRRTLSTHLGNLGLAPHVIGAILNHDPKRYQGITSVYNRADITFDKRLALQAWDRLLRLIVGDKALWGRVSEILRPEQESDYEKTTEFRRMILSDQRVWDAYLKGLTATDEENVVALEARR